LMQHLQMTRTPDSLKNSQRWIEGAVALNITTFSITTHSVTIKKVTLWITWTLCWCSQFRHYAECHGADCRYSECRYAECNSVGLNACVCCDERGRKKRFK
jgi:hypothetical protein